MVGEAATGGAGVDVQVATGQIQGGSMKPLVLYHGGGCADGFCAAFVAWLKLKDKADYRPVNYGEPFPAESQQNRDLFILDFSYSREVLMTAARRWCERDIVVLDHHKSAQKELESLGASNLGVKFDLTKSGAMLAWEYFFPDKAVPWLVEYTQDRDLWQWRLPNSKAVSAFIKSYPFDLELWKAWNSSIPGEPVWFDYINQGSAILRYQAQVVEQHVKNAIEIEMDGHKVLSLNATTMISEIGEKLCEGRPFSATWFQRVDGKRIWSLRSRKDGVDVSEIARKHGGGGHPGASGFEE
jgi:oligoribonuclease NrnB/cAMP/cGMP phosphodiesterase (DHH superfamily)